MRLRTLWFGTLMCAGSLVPDRLSAQARIVGVVVDSLRGGVPLLGATVVLMSSNRYASVDSLGRFVFDSVAGGEQKLALMHASLDALDVSLPPALVQVAGAGETNVTLAIPAVRTMHRMICGSDAPAGTGLVIGTVKKPAGADSVLGVNASWTETLIEDGKLTRAPRDVTITPDANGTFLLCGVPSSPSVRVTALAGRDTIGTSTFVLGGLGVARVALPVPVDERGVAIGPDGRPVQQLAGMAVRADASPAAAPAMGSYEGFEARRRIGLGAYQVVDEHSRNSSASLTDILARMRGVSADGRGRTRMPMLRGFMAARCIPNYFVDGTYIKVDTDVPRPGFVHTFSDLEANVPPQSIVAVEVYSSAIGIPPVYDMSGHTGCGTILIWTNRLKAPPPA